MDPIIALVTAGVEMDVLGLAYDQYTDAERESVIKEFPRTPAFKEDIIKAFYECFKQKPDTTFGTMNDDVLADKDKSFGRWNFCDVIRKSTWVG